MVKIFISGIFLITSLYGELLPLSKKSFNLDREDEYSRGTFLIVLSNANLYDNNAMDMYIELKKTQGYDVEAISFREGSESIDGINGQNANDLKDYLIPEHH